MRYVRPSVPTLKSLAFFYSKLFLRFYHRKYDSPMVVMNTSDEVHVVGNVFVSNYNRTFDVLASDKVDVTVS